MLKKRFFKTKDECEVTFELADTEAEQAQLVCELNGWQPIEMKKARKGPFRTRLRFPKEGTFEFRYLVDNRHWVNDDAADAYRPNGLGDENGVLDTISPQRGAKSGPRPRP